MAWQRSARAAAIDVGEALVLVARDGTVRRLEGDSASVAREVLACLAQPHDRDGVIAHVEALAGPLGPRRAVIDELLALLVETGALAELEPPPRIASPALARARGANIVVAITGAIAATHAPAFVLALQRRGHSVEIAVTETAQRFVALDALTAIVQRPVHTSLWPAAPHAPVPHVALAAWAELVIVYPASATTVQRIAHGDFSELVAATVLTTRAPVVIAPSMNAAMLAAPAVQDNLALLRQRGFAIVHGVPAAEAAEAPAVRDAASGAAVASAAAAAPAPGELAATIDALRAAGMLAAAPSAAAPTTWDAAYRGAVPWASDTCDEDIAAALAQYAPPPARLVDLGCGLGQIARHAAAAGYRVIATDVSEVALAAARARAAAAAASSREHAGATPPRAATATTATTATATATTATAATATTATATTATAATATTATAATTTATATTATATATTAATAPDILWLRDDICTTALASTCDVVVDRAVLHALPPARAAAWAAGIARLAPRTLIVKCHARGVSGATTGYTAAAIAALLPGYTVAADLAAELPGLRDATPIAARLVVLRAPAT